MSDRPASTRDTQQRPDMLCAFGEHTFSSTYLSPKSLIDHIGPHLDPTIAETHLFSEVRATPFPSALVQERPGVVSRSYMGLFPEIRHAWVTVDGHLYFWDYVKNSYKLAKSYPSLITAVALTLPPPSLFVDSVKYLLVTATAMSIHVDCVRVTPTSSHAAPSVGLSRDDMVIPVDDISVTALTCSHDGRIFYGDFYGGVYELVFVPSTSLWDKIPFVGAHNSPLPQKIRKINHTAGYFTRVLPDTLRRHMPGHPGPIRSMLVHPFRNILAILHEPGSSSTNIAGGMIQFVQLYDSSNTSIFRILLKLTSLLELAHQAVTVNAKATWLGASVSIVALHVIDPSESVRADFVAVTSTATRIYFAINLDSSVAKVEVRHIRLPPSGHSISVTAGSPPKYHTKPNAPPEVDTLRSNLIDNFAPQSAYTSYYARGVFLAAVPRDQAYDYVIGAAIDLPRDAKFLVQSPQSNACVQERAHLVRIPGRTHAICEIDPATGSHIDHAARRQFPVDEQDRPRHFLFLTSDGLRIIVKRRPVDELAYIVRAGLATFPEKFVPAYGRAQVCAWLIALACGDLGHICASLLPSPTLISGANPPVSNMYESQIHTSNPDQFHAFTPSSSSYSGNLRTSQIQRLFHEAGGQPQPASALSNMTLQRTELGHAVQRAQVDVSGCAEGLAVYLNHILKPVWDLPILVKNATSMQYEMSVSESALIRIQDKLSQLVNFIDAWPQRKDVESGFPGRGSVSNLPGIQVRAGDEYCWAREREFLSTLFESVKLALEAVRFVRLLAGYKLPSVAYRMPMTPECQALLDNMLHMPLCDLVKSTSGRETLGQVATQIVQLDTSFEDYAASSSTFTGTTLAHLLHEWCSNLLSIQDVYAASVLELIKQFRDSQGGRVPDEVWAQNVMQPQDNLLNEALRKALEVAPKLKEQHLIDICRQLMDVGFIRGVVDLCLRRASECDPQGLAVEYYRDPHRVYNEQRDLILQKRQVCYGLAIDALVKMRELYAQIQMQNRPELELGLSNAHGQVRQHVEKSKDELWHYELYKWYLSLGLDSALASLSTPYIEQWLRLQHSVHEQLLLAKYLESRNRYADAARTMLEVAIAPTYPDSNPASSYTLSERKTMLLNALQTAKATTDAALIQEIADHVDVAQLQELLANELELSSKSGGGDHLGATVHQLRHGPLLNLQEMHPLALEYKLTILQFQMYTIAGAELNIQHPEMVELWNEALREPVATSVGSAVAALTQLFQIGGSVRGQSSGPNVMESMVLQGGSAMGSPLYNARLWVSIVMDMSETSPELRHQPQWWVDVASRAEVVDMAGVAYELVERVRRAPVGHQESPLCVLVEVMHAWVHSSTISGAWGLLVSDCRHLLRNAPEYLRARFQDVEDVFDRQAEQVHASASFSASIYSAF